MLIRTAGVQAGVASIDPYIAEVTYTFLRILMFAVIARSLLTWFSIDPANPLIQLLHRVTEPIIDPFRKVIPNMGMIDLSPMAAILALIILQQLVASVVDRA
ncbi:MAG: YggT family protein [Dehalococcoidia bacterium]